MITNSEKITKHKEFMSMLKTFDLFKDKKITGESRYQTAFILTQYIDVLVCHQILNPLNYLYLDAAYLGYPVLHNASMCKDLGYYYENSDTVEGAKQLNYILMEIAKTTLKITNKGRETIQISYSKELIEKNINLFELYIKYKK